MSNQLTQAELDTIATYMQDYLREQIHAMYAPCEPMQFLSVYAQKDTTIRSVLRSEFPAIYKSLLAYEAD